MQGTTVREVKRVAKDQGITLEELCDQYEIFCFMGMWDNDDADVIVPDHFPIVTTTTTSMNVKIYY